jgi:hypothetical protein
LVLNPWQRANDLATIASTANQAFNAIKTALAQHCEFALWVTTLAMRKDITAPNAMAFLQAKKLVDRF